MSLVVAVDAMGGDHGPGVVVPAAIGYVRKHSDVRLILVGDEAHVDLRHGGTDTRTCACDDNQWFIHDDHSMLRLNQVSHLNHSEYKLRYHLIHL